LKGKRKAEETNLEAEGVTPTRRGKDYKLEAVRWNEVNIFQRGQR